MLVCPVFASGGRPKRSGADLAIFYHRRAARGNLSSGETEFSYPWASW